MSMYHPSVMLLVVVVGACGDHRDPPPHNASSTAEISCTTRASDLTTYLVQVVDPDATPAPPWPTGDVETDQLVQTARDHLRRVMAETSVGKVRPLLPGVKRGPVDDTLAGCPQARDAWANISNVSGPDRMTRAAAIGDGVKACDCHVNIPLIRAAFYVMVRGPD
jgi:hypothetical protein